MSLGVAAALDDPHLRPFPGDMSSRRGQSGDEAEQIQRDVSGELGRQTFSEVLAPFRIRQLVSEEISAAGRSVTRRITEGRAPQGPLPIRVVGRDGTDSMGRG